MSNHPKTLPASCFECVLAAIEDAAQSSLCIHAVVWFDHLIDEERMARAVQLLWDAELWLRYVFQEGRHQPQWRINHLTESDPFECIQCSEAEDCLQRVLAQGLERGGSPIKVYLIRSTKDVLCVKIDHKLGDGQATKQFLYRLAGAYSGLAVDPEYRPPTNQHLERTVTQVSGILAHSDQRRLLRQARSNRVSHARTATWHLPVPRERPLPELNQRYLMKRVESHQVAAIRAYAEKHEVTMNTVLLAAFARAASKNIPRSAGIRCEIVQTVDLRRHFQGKDVPYNCNLSSIIRLGLEQPSDAPLDAYVSALEDQMRAAKKDYIGLAHPLIRWEMNRIRRCLFRCLPFRLIKRVTRRRLRTLERRGFPAQVIFSNIGKISSESSSFGALKPEHACFFLGVLVPRGLLVVLASEFQDRLTFSIAINPQSVDEKSVVGLLDEMVQVLPR